MAYAATSLIFVALFAGCAHLLGRAMMTGVGAVGPRDGPATAVLAIPLGTGLLAVLAFILAALGLLSPRWIVLSVGLAVAIAAYALRKRGPTNAAPAQLPPSMGPWLKSAAGLLGLAAVCLAMSAPLEWDELAYHLPYARDYATAGRLVVSENLRFPLHSHNFQLLYAVALQFAHEPAAHLLHALSGALVAAGIFLFAHHHFGKAAAIVAVAMFLSSGGRLLDTAYVDLGVAMFVFFAFYSFALWRQSRSEGFLVLAAFLLAMAAGTKYQALVQLPVFALALVLASYRSPLRPLLVASAVFGVFASGWYVRNWLISGDPVHPLGADLFGFWLWDQGDLEGQFEDIARFRDHVPLELVPALGFLFRRRARDPALSSLLVVGFGGLAMWYVSSRYDRYLLPTYPFLAIMSAAVLVTAGQRLTRLFATVPEPGTGKSLRRTLPPLALTLVAAVTAWTIGAKWKEICFTRSCVDEVHAREFASPAAARAVPGFKDLKMYQLGLENEMYLLGDNTAGDWFGPYRYREVLELSGNAAALKRHLLGLGRDSLLVNRVRPPFSEFSRTFAPEDAFEEVYENPQVTLYRITGD